MSILDRIGNCEMCEREKPLTFHHLIPRKNHKRNFFKRRFSKEEMKHNGIMICQDGHSKIHQVHNEKELGLYYNTLEQLLLDPKIDKFIHWVKKKK